MCSENAQPRWWDFTACISGRVTNLRDALHMGQAQAFAGVQWAWLQGSRVPKAAVGPGSLKAPFTSNTQGLFTLVGHCPHSSALTSPP